MAKSIIKIENILGGRSNLQNFSTSGQFDSSIAIDPNLPATDSSIRNSGYLRPVSMSKFSGSEITGVPLWFVSNPKTTSTYLYANDGKVHTVTNTLSMGTALNSGTALTSSSGNGASYYDNYAYFAKNTDIARYGPLNGSPTLTQTYWSSTLSLTAPTNTTYPTLRGVQIPNHPMHRHVDNKLYFGDVNSSNQGILNYIKTTKTSVEGDTNNGSTYQALNFSYGQYPTCIESYGTDLAIGLIEQSETTSPVTIQKNAKISFWDTTSVSYNKIIDKELPDPFITAMKNVNGILFVWTGNANGGVRLLKFVGGYSFIEVAYLEEGVPPMQGAVDHDFERLYWGGYTTYPESFAVMYALDIVSNALQCVAKSTSSGATQNTTAVKFITQTNMTDGIPVIGWSDGTSKGLDSRSTTYGVSVFRSQKFRVGGKGQITKISIPLCQAVSSNMTLIPTIYTDNLTSSTSLTTINNTNYPNSDKLIVIRPLSLSFNYDFILELRWSGTALLTVALPITVEIETLET